MGLNEDGRVRKKQTDRQTDSKTDLGRERWGRGTGVGEGRMGRNEVESSLNCAYSQTDLKTVAVLQVLED